jgi:subfamily B ATP-binding cassette protein HlyB/CyaB
MTQSSAVVAEPAPTTKIDPTVREREPTGLGCLVVVARHHGLHLAVPQLIHDNFLNKDELSTSELVKCIRGAGLKAKVVHLKWDGLEHLKKVMPAIVRLTNGTRFVLRRIEGEPEQARVVLQDPNADDDALLVIDRVRFEAAWTGEVVLIKRNYEIAEEERPFSMGLLTAVIFRERRIVRDVAICAIMLGFLALAPIIFWRELSDRVMYFKSLNTFWVLCIAMAVVVAFEAAFSYLRRLLVLHLTSRLNVKLATYMFEKVLNLPIDYFERTPIGLIARDMNEIWRIRNFLIGQLFGTILDSTMLFFFLPVMFFFSPTLTAVVLGVGALIVLWLLVTLPTYRRRNAAAMAAEGDRGSFLIQTLVGMRTVKSLALDARQRHGWDVLVAKVEKLRFAEGLWATLIQAVVLPLERIMVSGSYAVGVYLAVTTNDVFYIGALFAFLIMSQRVAAPLMQMAKLVHELDEARMAVGMVGNVVNQPPEEGRTGNGVRAPIKGHIQFSNLTFKYAGTTSPALQDLSFEVPIGTTLGIMGRSGSGKTTITRLLQRLHSKYDGLIKIDDIDVREYDVDHLRGSLGVVLQENFLFSGSIRDNITIAKNDASYDDMVRAARLAGAEEFIEKLPRGYETYVYEGSPNLSGGQRQRLAIARALITDPRILILDEATSALDADSEAIVNANIARIAHGRTMIIISHRLSSLVTADAIMVLERGRLMDIGKHEELLARSEIYSGLWHTQNRHVVTPLSGRDKSFGGPRLVP